MIENEKFDKKLLETIKEKKSLPKPRWYFMAKNYIIWVAGFFSLLFGAISFALTIYILKFNYFDIVEKDHFKGNFQNFLLMIPFFWIICLIIFIVLFYKNIKHTKKGYRYSTALVLVITIFLSLILGDLFFNLGLGQKFDDILGRRAPFYDYFINPHVRFWSNPKEGRLEGLIFSQASNNRYVLYDEKRKEWILVFDNNTDEKRILLGRPMRFFGKIIKNQEFLVEETLPIFPGKEFFNRPERINNFFPKEKNIQKLKNNCDNEKILIILRNNPEIKKIITESLKINKEIIRNSLKKDPEIIYFLKFLEIENSF